MNNHLKTKKNIEDYYSTNKDFFNTTIEKSNNISFDYHNNYPIKFDLI